MHSGQIHSINVSNGGVPKLPVSSALVTKSGIEGDRQAKPGIHGGIYKAVSLFSLEAIQALAAQGHPITPGGTGENITLSGNIWDQLAPGKTIKLGHSVILKLTSYATPCPTIAANFSDGDVTRMHHGKNSRFSRLYAQVLEEGEITRDDKVTLMTST